MGENPVNRHLTSPTHHWAHVFQVRPKTNEHALFSCANSKSPNYGPTGPSAHNRRNRQRNSTSPPVAFGWGAQRFCQRPKSCSLQQKTGRGFGTHVEQLRTLLGAQSSVLLAQYEPQRCPVTRSDDETGASTLHLQVCAPRRGSSAARGGGVGSLPPWQHVLLPHEPPRCCRTGMQRTRTRGAGSRAGRGRSGSICVLPAHGQVVGNLQRSYSCRSR